MTEVQAETKTNFAARLPKVLARIAFFFAVGFLIGWLLNRAEAALERRNQPAGFTHGVVQGALMPIALPNLAVGKDVSIYATRNTGRTYKLGYTVGVNVCGLIFFGLFFSRLKHLAAKSKIQPRIDSN